MAEGGSRRLSARRAGTVVLLATAGAMVSTTIGHGQASTPFQPPSPPPAAVSDRTRAFQLIVWYKLEGQADILHLTSDYQSFNREVEAVYETAVRHPHDLVRLNVSRFHALCSALAKDALAGERYLPIPDSTLQPSWSRALQETKRGSRDCLAWLDKPHKSPADRKDITPLYELADGMKTSATAVTDVLRAMDDAHRYWPGLVRHSGTTGAK